MESYTAAQRQAIGKKVLKAKAALSDAMTIAKEMAKSAYAEGVPETQIASDLGVDRMSVRKWLGKR